MKYTTYFELAYHQSSDYKGIEITTIVRPGYTVPVIIYNIDMLKMYSDEIINIRICPRGDNDFLQHFSDEEISYIYASRLWLYTDQFRINV